MHGYWRIYWLKPQCGQMPSQNKCLSSVRAAHVTTDTAQFCLSAVCGILQHGSSVPLGHGGWGRGLLLAAHPYDIRVSTHKLTLKGEHTRDKTCCQAVMSDGRVQLP